jgi:hypothetical protein
MARGRPKNQTRAVRIAIAGWLHPEHDADILAWWQTIPKGARMNALKTALRSGGMGQDSPIEADTDEIQRAADDILDNWSF